MRNKPFRATSNVEMKLRNLWLILALLALAVNSFAADTVCACGAPNAAKPKGTIIAGHNIKVLSRPAPIYPPEAKAAKISGSVMVAVIFDEEGKVIWAKANDGHPLLQQAAVEAACKIRARPKSISGTRIKFYGITTYKFVLD